MLDFVQETCNKGLRSSRWRPCGSDHELLLASGRTRLWKGWDRLASATVRLMHDRRIPKIGRTIDHIAVTANGLYVIDAKKFRGRPHLKIEGGLSGSQRSRPFPDTRRTTGWGRFNDVQLVDPDGVLAIDAGVVVENATGPVRGSSSHRCSQFV